MYTFNVDCISSYELGGEESQIPVNGTNLFTSSADDILSRMGKLELLCVSLFERVGELEKALQSKQGTPVVPTATIGSLPGERGRATRGRQRI